MKRSECKSTLRRYADLLRINTVNTWRMDTAYFGNAWGNLLSTVVYTLTFIVFISAIYANVRAIAGYTRDEMLLLAFVGQITYYTTYVYCWNNIPRLVEDVNRGSFDLLLVKPVPSLFYASIRNISVLPQLRDGLPSLLFLALVVNWSAVSVSWIGVVCGIVIMLLGQLAVSTFALFLALPVFWFGQATDSVNLGYTIFSGYEIPYGGMPAAARFVLTYLVPVAIPSMLATAVMLGKVAAIPGVAIALSATAILVAIKLFAWRIALRNYTSASS